MPIWVDADALPRPAREVLLRIAGKREVEVVFVANRYQGPEPLRRVRHVMVGAGEDMADHLIAEQCAAGDLVVTFDIPLASRVVEKGAQALTPHGRVLDAGHIGEALSQRNFADYLRTTGEMGGGPPPYSANNKRDFANALDRWLARQPGA